MARSREHARRTLAAAQGQLRPPSTGGVRTMDARARLGTAADRRRQRSPELACLACESTTILSVVEEWKAAMVESRLVVTTGTP